MVRELNENEAIFEYFTRKAEAGSASHYDDDPAELTDRELLRSLLSLVAPVHLANNYADELLARFGSLGAITAAPATLLQKDVGLPPPAVFLLNGLHEYAMRSLREPLQNRPVISTWSALMDYLATAMQHEQNEHFRMLFLDRKNILIRDEVQSRGTVDHTPLYPREVVKRALELGASAVIMVHNHPSGDPTPSQPDIDMTRQVVEALRSVNITVHDHVIVGKGSHTSFKSSRLIL